MLEFVVVVIFLVVYAFIGGFIYEYHVDLLDKNNIYYNSTINEIGFLSCIWPLFMIYRILISVAYFGSLLYKKSTKKINFNKSK